MEEAAEEVAVEVEEEEGIDQNGDKDHMIL